MKQKSLTIMAALVLVMVILAASAVLSLTGTITLGSKTTPTQKITGTTTTQRQSGPELYHPFDDKKDVAVPIKDITAYFTVKDDRITGWKSGAGYDSEKNLWIADDGLAIQYRDGGILKTRTVDNIEKQYVQIWSSSGDDYSTTSIPTQTFDRYKSLIDVKNVKSDESPIPLTNGGSLEYSEDPNTGLATFKVDKGGNAPSEETIWSFGGNDFKSTEGWGETSAGSLENKGQNRAVTFEFNSEDNTKTMIEAKGKTGDFTSTILDKDLQRTIINGNAKTGDIRSYQVLDKNGKRVGEGFFTKGELDHFEHLDDKGRVNGFCYEESCVGNPNDNNNYFVKEIRECNQIQKSSCWYIPENEKNPVKNEKNFVVTGQKVCHGSKDFCSNENNFKTEKEACSNKDSDACKAIQSKQTDDFTHFEGTGWNVALGKTKVQQTIGRVLSYRPGWEGLSLWWLPDETKKWRKWSSEQFDKALLAEYVVPQEVCEYNEKHQVKKPGETAVFQEVAPGIVQMVCAATAEKSPAAGPILCSKDVPCVLGNCEDDGLCHDANTDKILEGFFYKISWGVQAPRDEAFTPYIDENGYAIKFNVKVYGDGERWLYHEKGATFGTDSTLQLKNGATDRDTIATYSPRNYNKICLIFGAPAKDLKGEEVRECCADIIGSTVGQIQWQQAGRPSGSNTGFEREVHARETERTQI